MFALRFAFPFCIFCLLDLALIGAQEADTPNKQSYFHIQVIDRETRRGVPMVELTTVSGVRLYTDSAGNVAFNETDLMDKDVFFHVASHGYQFRKDGFGYRGTRLKTVRGKKSVIEIDRINIAKRLYRITGAGIYRDTKLLGIQPPTDSPSINSQVVGCDSVVNAVYRDRLYWFWGDTNRLSYPLGNFQVTGATTANPSSIDASNGFKLDYFRNRNGFAKSMAPVPGKGPTWIFGAFVTRDEKGKQRLVAKYEKIKPPLEAYQRGLVLFNDDKEQFEPFVEFPLNAPLYPDGQAFVQKQNDREYVYFATPFPFTRVVNEIQKIKNPNEYEAYTYFKTGAKPKQIEKANPEFTEEMFDRDKQGKLVIKWRKNSQPISPRLELKLINQGLIKATEAISILRPNDKQIRAISADQKDAKRDTANRVTLSSGSVAWNKYRNKWILIGIEVWGTSLLGEIWFAESNNLEGPWINATKIVTHDNYSFYNPRHHPYFDQKGGRIIYFEGTYTKMFSGTKVATPRYDYNQIMYQLDLKDIEKSATK